MNRPGRQGRYFPSFWLVIPEGVAIFCMVEAGLVPYSGSSLGKGVGGTWRRHIFCPTTRSMGMKRGWGESPWQPCAHLQFHSVRLRGRIWWATRCLTAFLLVPPLLLKLVGSDSGLTGNRKRWGKQARGRRGLGSIKSHGVGLTHGSH